MILIACAQGSPEWHQARAGVITASMFACARGRYKTNGATWKKGEWKKTALDYAFQLAIERISGRPLDEGYETWAMARGHELEPTARARHMEETGVWVERVGFVMTDDRRFGCSLDGVIDHDGSAEYKCFIDPTKLRALYIDGDIGEVYEQAMGGLWVTGRKWIDVAFYCPGLAPAGKDLWVQRFERDDDYIAEMESDLVAFLRLVNEYEKILRAPVGGAEKDKWPFPNPERSEPMENHHVTAQEVALQAGT